MSEHIQIQNAMSCQCMSPGLQNFRDIGGYSISLTQCIREGIVYRSASTDHVDRSHVDGLQASHDIRIIFDLRSAGERMQQSSPPAKIPIIGLPAVAKPDGITLKKYFDGLLDNAPLACAELYQHICAHSNAAFYAIFKYIRDNPGKPLLVQCELGKDRTGVFIGVLLFVLGASEHDIISDYALSQKGIEGLVVARKEKLSRSDFMKDVSPSLVALDRHFMALPESMILFLSYLKDTYGNGQGYLESIGLRVEDFDKIRSNMTREV
ncbi:hypothetical protein N7494_006288 [Penicillium frequentans]|uniref:Tyrosine specific protein phosphatases domain-containing protein n=1 Tax=Penicillium frequentans TaxID=3151616 RepID=A0AAD6CW37_9EURO|nr:hypothetical protein N7494_006288 [Penicillium glabrum]